MLIKISRYINLKINTTRNNRTMKNKDIRMWYSIFRFTIYSFGIILRTDEVALSMTDLQKVVWRIYISFELLSFSIFCFINIIWFLNFSNRIMIKDITCHWKCNTLYIMHKISNYILEKTLRIFLHFQIFSMLHYFWWTFKVFYSFKN